MLFAWHDIDLRPGDHLRAAASAWLPRGGERLAAGVWLLLSLVLAQMYRSNLKAMMILPRLRLPFDSLEELIESGITCYIVPDTITHKRIMVNIDWYFHKAVQFVRVFPKKVRPKFTSSFPWVKAQR